MYYKFILPLIIFFSALYIPWFEFENFADDPGLGWHLQSGFYFLDNFSFPKSEPFLANASDRAFLSNQWLAELGFAWVYNNGGWPALYCLLGCVFIFLVWQILFISGVYLSKSAIVSLILLYFTANLLTIHFIVRPVLFQLLFFAICLASIYFLRKLNFSEIKSFKWIYLFTFLLFALWTNCHPSFLLGIVVIGIWDFLAFIAWFRHRSSCNKSIELKLATSILLIASISTLFNPYLLKLHFFILNYLASDYSKTQREWMSPAVDSSEFLLLCLLSLIWLILIFLSRAYKKESLWFAIVSTLPFLIMSFNSIRYLPLFSLTFFFAATELTQPVLARLKSSLILPYGKIIGIERTVTLSTAIIISLAILVTSLTNNVPFYSGEYGPAKEKFPYLAVEWIETDLPESKTLLNHPDWGGFITFASNGRLKPMFDDRNYLLDKAFLYAGIKFVKEPDFDTLKSILPAESTLLLFPRRSKAGQWLVNNFHEFIVYLNQTSVVVKIDVPA